MIRIILLLLSIPASGQDPYEDFMNDIGKDLLAVLPMATTGD
jgi:hypothetical protein